MALLAHAEPLSDRTPFAFGFATIRANYFLVYRHN